MKTPEQVARELVRVQVNLSDDDLSPRRFQTNRMLVVAGVICKTGPAAHIQSDGEKLQANIAAYLRLHCKPWDTTEPIEERSLLWLEELLEEIRVNGDAGPWYWGRDYGLRDGDHWCMSNAVKKEEGHTLDGDLVTVCTRDMDYNDDGQPDGNPATRPLWQFLARSWEIVQTLLARSWVDALAIHDLQMEQPAYEAGKVAGLRQARKAIQVAYEELDSEPDNIDALFALNTVHQQLTQAPLQPLRPDEVHEENRLLRKLIRELLHECEVDPMDGMGTIILSEELLWQLQQRGSP